MGLLLELEDHLKMRVVHVGVHPEEPLEDGPDHLAKVLREGSPCNLGKWPHHQAGSPPNPSGTPRTLEQTLELASSPSFHQPTLISTYFGPADMIGQVDEVQNSIRVPYRKFTWLKNLLLTASHSLRSSPIGRRTASRRFPLPRVASMC
ncbi:Os03g0409500, partial [Oryza sativa Japonica Group]